MGFNSDGVWTSDFYPVQDRDAGVRILASKFQYLIQTDIKNGFNNCLTRDGSGKPEANLNLNGYKIANLANGDLSTDAVNLGQVQLGTTNYATDTSNTANAIIITLSPSISAYTVGQRFYFKVANTNTSSEVSFRANNLDICRVRMDGVDNLVIGALKQNCIYEGIYYETGSSSEATYGGRRIQIIGSSSELDNKLNNSQVTNCILSAPNGVATQSGLVITVENDVKFLIYHGLKADGTIDNIEYFTTANPTYTFAGTEADGTYYLFINNSGVISPSTSPARQTDKAIFAECVIESGSITTFRAYGALELVKKEDVRRYLTYSYVNGTAWVKVFDEIQSDGTVKQWCEQGDVVARISAAAQTLTFPLPFADTNYTLVQNFQGDTANGNTGEFENGYYNKTTTGFTKKSTVALTYINEFSYIAFGYIS